MRRMTDACERHPDYSNRFIHIILEQQPEVRLIPARGFGCGIPYSTRQINGSNGEEEARQNCNHQSWSASTFRRSQPRDAPCRRPRAGGGRDLGSMTHECDVVSCFRCPSGSCHANRTCPSLLRNSERYTRHISSERPAHRNRNHPRHTSRYAFQARSISS